MPRRFAVLFVALSLLGALAGSASARPGLSLPADVEAVSDPIGYRERLRPDRGLIDTTTPLLAARTSTVERQVAETLEGTVGRFEIVELPADALPRGEDGVVPLPLAGPDGDVVEILLPFTRTQLRDPELTHGVLRSGEDARRVPLPPEQNYRIGGCERGAEFCGAITVLDRAQTTLTGMVLHPELGLSFIEPVGQLLGAAGEYPYLHVVYHTDEAIVPQIIDRLEDDRHDHGHDEEHDADFDDDFTSATATTGIVLDGTESYYDIDPSTVWARQEAVHNMMSVIYGFIEPLSWESPNTAGWGLDLQIKGQETWVNGGPTTTNKITLTNEITDPDYFLLTPVDEDELHLLLVGHDVSGVLGRAAGIGNTSGGFGGGSGQNHAFTTGMAHYTAKTRWVVATHEVGHLLGGHHGDGTASGCTTVFALITTVDLCGTSIMPAGGVAAADDREPFFTDANDANIAGVLNAVFP